MNELSLIKFYLHAAANSTGTPSDIDGVRSSADDIATTQNDVYGLNQIVTTPNEVYGIREK